MLSIQFQFNPPIGSLVTTQLHWRIRVQPMQVEKNWSSSTFPFFQIFAGNSDSTSVIRQPLLHPIQTRFLRLTILTAHRLSNNHACLRMEIYGCSKGKSHIYFILLLVACVQTSPLPQKKSIFSEGGGTSVHSLPCGDVFTLFNTTNH